MQDAPGPTRPRSSGWIAAAAAAAFALGLLAHPLLFRDEPSDALRAELSDLNAQVGALNDQVTGALAALREGELAEIQRGLAQLDQRMGETERALRAAGAGGGPAQAPPEVSADDDPALGPADAPVLIVAFSDFQCPFCTRFWAETMPALVEEYVEPGTVRFVFRDFPLAQIHPNAIPAAMAAECADDQGAFWPMHDALFERQADWARAEQPKAVLAQYAAELGLEAGAFDACLQADRHVDELQNDLMQGLDYGVSGTPTFFVNGEKLVGALPIERFRAAVERALAN